MSIVFFTLQKYSIILFPAKFTQKNKRQIEQSLNAIKQGFGSTKQDTDTIEISIVQSKQDNVQIEQGNVRTKQNNVPSEINEVQNRKGKSKTEN
jgi:hypothetical protein